MRTATLFHPLRRKPIPIMAIWLLAMVGPAWAADQPFDVVVTANSTPVMAGAKPNDKVLNGTRLTVTQTNGNWYLIEVPAANPPQQGWISKSDVQATASIAASAQPPSKAPEIKPLEPEGLFTPQQFDRLGERNKFQEQKRELIAPREVHRGHSGRPESRGDRPRSARRRALRHILGPRRSHTKSSPCRRPGGTKIPCRVGRIADKRLRSGGLAGGRCAAVVRLREAHCRPGCKTAGTAAPSRPG